MASRDPRQVARARRAAAKSARGQRVLERETRQARRIERERTQRIIGDKFPTDNIGELVREIGSKPTPDSKTGRFDGLPKYSAATVRKGVENMSDYERGLARRISSHDYRERASIQGNFNVWWYHGGKRGKK